MNAIEPFRECPRFDFCSVNHCPLDPEQDKRASDPGDKEPKCTLAKTIRQRIGSKYPELLPMGGLTQREFNNAKRWALLPEAEKAATLSRLKAHSFVARGKNDKTNDQTHSGPANP
jgi:hypothetical protein